jgi:hypothetical protein
MKTSSFNSSAFPRGLAMAFGFAAAVVSVTPAVAQLSIAATFDSSITSDPNAAAIEGTINQAIAFYQAHFSDPITVTIEFQEMNAGLGQSNTTLYGLNYSTVRAAMAGDAKDANDTTALANTPAGANEPVSGKTTIALTTANIKALGIGGSFPPTFSSGFDGVIGLNTSLMNFTRTSIDSSKYDLLAVAEHEIDEVLGLGSGLNLPASFAFIRPEDLFRYSSTPGVRNYTTSGDNAFFSINGGVTDLARFNQNSGGDYGDWWSTGAHTPQVQDAFGTPGAIPNLGVELTALDVIGYDLVTPPVPEPSTYGLMGAAVLGGAIVIRRRRKA